MATMPNEEAPPEVGAALDLLRDGMMKAEAERAEVYRDTAEDYERGQDAMKQRRTVDSVLAQIAAGYDNLAGASMSAGLLQRARQEAKR